MQERVIIKITGIVQGVFFREFVKDFAEKLKIKGTIQNLPDRRSVEIIAEGENEDLRALLKVCHEGPKNAVVENVEVTHETPIGEFKSFRIKF